MTQLGYNPVDNTFTTMNRKLENFLYYHNLELLRTGYDEDMMVTVWTFVDTPEFRSVMQEWEDINSDAVDNSFYMEKMTNEPFKVQNRALNKFLYLHNILPLYYEDTDLIGRIWYYQHTLFLEATVAEFRSLRRAYHQHKENCTGQTVNG